MMMAHRLVSKNWKNEKIRVPSNFLKKLILFFLKSNLFRFRENPYKQVKSTSMGTPMAVNYANIILGKIENGMLEEYEKKKKMKPFMWMRSIENCLLFC